MTLIDVVRMIGDALTELDVAVGSMAPADPNLVPLQDIRRLLDARQLSLSRQAFDENTTKFKKAAAALSAVNDEIGQSLQRIDDTARLVENATRFLDAVSGFMGTIGAFV